MLTTLKFGYYLGIDGGGTKTRAIITDESGFVLGEGVAGGSNPHNVSTTDAVQNILAAIQLAKEQTYRKKKDVIPEHIIFESACLGLAGLDTEKDREHVSQAIQQLPKNDTYFKAKKLLMVNDGLIGLKSATDENWGICLVAGTGANCYGLSRTGKETVAGDWGFILGDQGSAFALGRAILQQIMKEYDGRKPTTRISQEVLAFLDLKSPTDLVEWTYRSTIPVSHISQLAQLCDHTSLSDSVEMNQIILYSIQELLEAYTAVVRKLQFKPEDPFPVALVGGLFTMKGKYAEQVMRSILNLTPNVNVVFPVRSSAEGAAKIARAMTAKFSMFPQTAVLFVNPDHQHALS